MYQLNVWLKQDVICVIEKENKECFAKISSDMVVILKHTGRFPDTTVSKAVSIKVFPK